MFKTPFSFEGRIRRLEYGLSYLIFVGSIVLFAALSEISSQTSFLGLGIIPMIWFMLAQVVKRCHDRGNSGWYLLIPFYRVILLFAESDYGPNKYGPNPKGEGNFDEVNEIGRHLVD